MEIVCLQMICSRSLSSKTARYRMDIYRRYAPFIQEFIYRNNWENLRAIQAAAGDAIFNTEENVLLSASTATRKGSESE